MQRAVGALFVAALIVRCTPGSATAAAPSVSAIRLVDQRGQAFTLNDLRGRRAAIAFIATRCTDTCPLTDAIFERVASAHMRGRLLTITLDPLNDTAFVMARHAQALAAAAPAWRVARGRPADSAVLFRAFGVEAASPQVHSAFIYLMTAQGRCAAVVPIGSRTIGIVRAWLAGTA